MAESTALTVHHCVPFAHDRKFNPLVGIHEKLEAAFPDAESVAVEEFDAGYRVGIAVKLNNGKRNAVRVEDDLEAAIRQLREWVDEEA